MILRETIRPMNIPKEGVSSEYQLRILLGDMKRNIESLNRRLQEVENTPLEGPPYA